VVTSGGLRERRRAQTRREIAAVAVDLFERQGFEATTVEQIAVAADVSPRTFFRYFESKVDILLPSLHDERPDLEQRFATRPAGEGPVEAVHHVLREELQQVLADDPLSARQYRIMLSTPALRPLALQHFHEHMEEMARVFADRLGTLPDALRPQIMAAAVSGSIWAVLDHWVAHGGAIDDLLPLFDEAFAVLRESLR
jgi:AcrR family transcriptional regulator